MERPGSALMESCIGMSRGDEEYPSILERSSQQKEYGMEVEVLNNNIDLSFSSFVSKGCTLVMYGIRLMTIDHVEVEASRSAFRNKDQVAH